MATTVILRFKKALKNHSVARGRGRPAERAHARVAAECQKNAAGVIDGGNSTEYSESMVAAPESFGETEK